MITAAAPRAPALTPIPRSRLLPLADGIAEGILRYLPLPDLPPALSKQVVQAVARATAAVVPLPSLPDLPDPAPTRLLDLLAGRDVGEAEGKSLGAQVVPDALNVLRRFVSELPDIWEELFDSPAQAQLAASMLGVQPAAATAASAPAPSGAPPGPAPSSQDPERGSPRTIPGAHRELRTLFPVEAPFLPPIVWLRYTAIAWQVQLGSALARTGGLIIPSTSAIGQAVHTGLQASYVQRLHFRGIPPRELIVEDAVWLPGALQPFQLGDFTSGPVRFQAARVSFRSVKDSNRRPDALDLSTPELWEIKPVLSAPDAVAQLYRYSEGYRCAFEQLIKAGNVATPDEPSAVALGTAKSDAFPVFESVRATRGLAVTFSLDGLPGVLLYVIVNYRKAWEAAKRIIKDLRDLAKQIQETLRRLSERFGDWQPPALPSPETVPAWALAVLATLAAALIIIGVFALIGALVGTPPAPVAGTAAGALVGAAAGVAFLIVVGVLVKRMLDSQEREARNGLAAIGLPEPPAGRSQARPPRGTPSPPLAVAMRTALGSIVIPPSSTTQIVWIATAAATLIAHAGADALTSEFRAIEQSLATPTVS